MVPGTGRSLRWYVTVGGQRSLLSASVSSYAAPTVWSVAPGNYPTTGSPLVAGSPSLVTVAGVNFGLTVPGSQLVVRINSQMRARPAGWAAYRAAILASQVSQRWGGR